MSALLPAERGPAPTTSTLHRRLAATIGLIGAAVCAVSVTFIVRSVPADEAVGRGTIELLVISVPIAAGLYAIQVPENVRFGLALIATGFAWSLTALGESEASLPYSVGRVAAWLVFPSLIFLMTAFPSGRVTRGVDRTLFRALNGLLVLGYIGSALFVEHYPEHTPWATCLQDCPPNAFLVLDSEPAFMESVVQPLRELFAILLFAAVVGSMAWRWRAATPLRRRTLLPVLLASGASVGLLAAFLVVRRSDPSAPAVETLGLLWGLCVAGLAAAFWVGLVRRRLLVGDVLARLTGQLSDGVDAGRLRDVLRTALCDPTLDVLVADGPVRWLDSCGRRVGRLPVAAGRELTIIRDDSGVSVVALVHAPGLRGDEELLGAISGIVREAVRHHEVTTRLAATLRQLEQSRRRIAEAADLERARIERDLHDGAQQRLMMLRIRLSLAEELLRTDPVGGADALHELGTEAERTLEELRALAHGVYPPILSDRGLEEALRSLAADVTVPLHLQTIGLTRQPMEIETAVYFTCLEAVQNAIKHAPTATAVWVQLEQRRTLALEVRDDGPGFRLPVESLDGTLRSCSGLRNMRDRLEAVGGSLSIDSAPGRGTRIIGLVPLDAHASV
ncbi:histidine kinase [Solirubrobacter phytolaccae]|uniref:histidine kinase n=1 Tax=Solirubrobacter phytolaccae TaxID=1404360 RepID=A0A9X3SBG1_9ACTN|nr:histidine kinase [Solirubrobacter phytolaccae]MDA0181355.1 histidine kinase [Solirubrobacter phytolaccae]